MSENGLTGRLTGVQKNEIETMIQKAIEAHVGEQHTLPPEVQEQVDEHLEDLNARLNAEAEEEALDTPGNADAEPREVPEDAEETP